MIEILTGLSYQVYHKILNTENYGIPQHRERWYCVGIRCDIAQSEFRFPDTHKTHPLSSFLSKRVLPEDLDTSLGPIAQKNLDKALERIRDKGGDPCKECWIVDVDASESRCHFMKERCPTLMKGRGRGYWITHLKRRMTLQEAFLMQRLSPILNWFLKEPSPPYFGMLVIL